MTQPSLAEDFLRKINQLAEIKWFQFNSEHNLLIRFAVDSSDVEKIKDYLDVIISKSNPEFWDYGVRKQNMFYLSSKKLMRIKAEDSKRGYENYAPIEVRFPELGAETETMLQNLLENMS